jgi:hypothetical protein
MLIFLAIVLGPGCGFMLYALYQFSREARRFRHADPRRLNVTVVRATDTLTGASTGTSDQRTRRDASETPESRAVLKNKAAPAKFAAGGEEPAQGKMVTTYLHNCLGAIPPGTGRVAMKRVAKGSS